jgi:hypothetical protein
LKAINLLEMRDNDIGLWNPIVLFAGREGSKNGPKREANR